MSERSLSRLRIGRPVRPRTPIDSAALRAARVSLDMSVESLARLLAERYSLRVSVPALRRYEHGKVSPPDDARAALERVLGVSLAVRP
jgi:ribosome-binding protein aMBF1 (putative translation factor)